jgi:hypothetical protein
LIYQIGEILEPVASLGALFLILVGVMWIIFGLYEGKRRGSLKERKVEDWDFKITKLLKVLTFLGFIVGFLAIVVGIAGLVNQVPPSPALEGRSYFTSILLIVLGIFTFIKPANDLPLSSMIGFLIATVLTVIVIILIPSKVYQTIEVWGLQVVLVIIFVILFAVIGILAKFYSKMLMNISKWISWPPIAIILALFCFIQGFLLFYGLSIIPI